MTHQNMITGPTLPMHVSIFLNQTALHQVSALGLILAAGLDAVLLINEREPKLKQLLKQLCFFDLGWKGRSI